MTDSEHILGLFRDSGALLEGHFQLSSGLHSSRYLQCAKVLEDPARAGLLGGALAALLAEKPTTVVSPALGGVIIGHEVARALGVLVPGGGERKSGWPFDERQARDCGDPLQKLATRNSF